MISAEQKRLFTVDEYHLMGEVGILRENRVELIEGEILTMSPIGAAHIGAVNKLNRYLNQQWPDRWIVSVQNPLKISRISEPQPDLAILKYRPDFYSAEKPSAPDAVLLIEVCDSSLPYDKEVKVPLYAQADIPETWLLDLEKNCLIQYLSPQNGLYLSVREFFHSETCFSPTLGLTISLSDILQDPNS